MQRIDDILNDSNFNFEFNKRIAEAKNKRRNFFKVYHDLVLRLKEIDGVELKMLIYLGDRMDFNKSRITLDDQFWKELLSDMDMSRDYARRVLKRLREKAFIYFDKFYLYVGGMYISKKR